MTRSDRFAPVAEHAIAKVQRPEPPEAECSGSTAQCQQPPVEAEDRRGLGLEVTAVRRSSPPWERQPPRPLSGGPSVVGTPVRRQRTAASARPPGSTRSVGRDHPVHQPHSSPWYRKGVPAAQEEHGRRPGPGLAAPLGGGGVLTEHGAGPLVAGPVARVVMVGQDPGGPGAAWGQSVDGRSMHPGPGVLLPEGEQRWEVEGRWSSSPWP